MSEQSNCIIEKVCNVKLIKMYDDVIIPEYKTSGSSGMDIHAYLTDDFIVDHKRIYGDSTVNVLEELILIPPHETIPIPTGIKVKIPENYEIQVRSRSGLAINGLIVANEPGTIDSDFIGQIKIIILNTTNTYKKITHGDRIAQLIFAKVDKMSFEIVDVLDETGRGEGGFGSTGIN